MKCQFCGFGDTQVLESRVPEDGNSVRRRRECAKCKKRFTTYEKVKAKLPWVVKKDGGREPFDREKIRRGILKAIEKRPITPEQVDDILDHVELEMINKHKEGVSSREIGGAVSRRLKSLDKVAWLRFASVYFEFEDLRDFEKAIKR